MEPRLVSAVTSNTFPAGLDQNEEVIEFEELLQILSCGLGQLELNMACKPSGCKGRIE